MDLPDIISPHSIGITISLHCNLSKRKQGIGEIESEDRADVRYICVLQVASKSSASCPVQPSVYFLHFQHHSAAENMIKSAEAQLSMK